MQLLVLGARVGRTVTLVRTWSSFAVIVIAQSYLCAMACAQSLALADTLTLRPELAATACITDDACASKQIPSSTFRAFNAAEEIVRDGRRAAVDSKTLNVWTSVSISDLIADDRSSAESLTGIRSGPHSGLHLAQDTLTPYPAYDVRARLKEEVRKELGGWSPTGLNTLVHGRKKLGVDFRLRFR
jgi:hypothetical protein